MNWYGRMATNLKWIVRTLTKRGWYVNTNIG